MKKAAAASINIFLLVLVLFSFSSCTKKDPGLVDPETRQIVFDKPAPIPPGVVRYCWEEPMVAFEPNGPGIDTDGHWYKPAYTAVREVKQGRWRPCSPVLSEVKGETKYER